MKNAEKLADPKLLQQTNGSHKIINTQNKAGHTNPCTRFAQKLVRRS